MCTRNKAAAGSTTSNTPSQLNVIPGRKSFAEVTLLGVLQICTFVSELVKLQLGMLISLETVPRLFIHHTRAHESTLTNDQMRPHFNLILLILIIFLLLSPSAHIQAGNFQLPYDLDAIITGKPSSLIRVTGGPKNRRFVLDAWVLFNGKSV